MSIRTVQAAIRHVREVEAEWKEADLGHWLENHTRYALIDPVIRALGWKTCDPKECHSEYGRSNEGQKGMADYVLFGTPDLEGIGNGDAVPDIIIESKSLYGRLDGNVEQLQRYVEGGPSDAKGKGGAHQRRGVVGLRRQQAGSLFQEAGRTSRYPDRQPAAGRSNPELLVEPETIRMKDWESHRSWMSENINGDWSRPQEQR